MIAKMAPHTWQQVIDVNLTGVFYCLQAVGCHMLERIAAGDASPASIVNISSVHAIATSANIAAYAASSPPLLAA